MLHKRIILFLSFVLVSFYTYSNSYLDSLLGKLNKEKNTENKIILLHELSWEYSYINIDSAEMFAQKALEIIIKDTVNYKSYWSFNLGIFGIINDIKGNRPEALYYYQKSLEIKMQIKDSIGISSTLTNIGALFYSQKMYFKAFDYFKKSLEIEQLLKNNEGIEGSYVNLAIIFKNLNQKDSAIIYLNKAAEINNETKNLYQNAYINANLGTLYFETKDYEMAKIYFDKAIVTNRLIDNKRALAISLENRAKIYLYQNMKIEAKSLLDEAIQIAKTGKFIDTQLKVYETLFEWALLNDNIELSQVYKDSVDIFKDSIYNEEINNQINEIDTKYKVEKNKIQILEQETLLVKNKAKFQILYISLILSFIIITILILFFILYRRSNKIVKAKNEIILKAFEERELLIREIHHRVKNNIQSIKSLLNLHKRRTNDDALKLIIENIINRLHSMTFVHETLYQHSEIFDLNIDEYLTDFIVSIIESYGLSYSEENIKINLPPAQMPIDQLLTVGLLVNEIVSNASKYALNDGVLQLNIEGVYEKENKIYILTVQDFGKGLKESNSSNFGMELIELMTAKLDGKIKFTNNNKGLHIYLSFPIA
jgi:two-component system, sensor histidine kinase PdtaS